MVGRGRARLAADDALDFVGGYSRQRRLGPRLQFDDGQWLPGKSFDTFPRSARS